MQNPTYVNQSNINRYNRTKLLKKFLLTRGRYYRELENVLRSIVLGTLRSRESAFNIESPIFLRTITIANNDFNHFNYPYKIAKETVPNSTAIDTVPFSQSLAKIISSDVPIIRMFRSLTKCLKSVAQEGGQFLFARVAQPKLAFQVDTEEERDARYHRGLVNFRRAASERASAKDDGNNKGLKGQEDRVRADRGRKGGATSAMAWKREAIPLASLPSTWSPMSSQHAIVIIVTAIVIIQLIVIPGHSRLVPAQSRATLTMAAHKIVLLLPAAFRLRVHCSTNFGCY